MQDVSELIKIELDDIIGLNLEDFLGVIAELAGWPLLVDIKYFVEGHEGNTLQLRVSGCVESYGY